MPANNLHATSCCFCHGATLLKTSVSQSRPLRELFGPHEGSEGAGSAISEEGSVHKQLVLLSHAARMLIQCCLGGCVGHAALLGKVREEGGKGPLCGLMLRHLYGGSQLQ